jgi:DNA-binding transcriptional MerR regulator
MNRAAVAIPEKLFFKIGEVCDLTGVQAHVLRYWESEFPMLAPQKNRAGQRTYRKRDVEMVLRIKELLYDELYTIAGAKKKLISELRGASKLKVVTPDNGAALNIPNNSVSQPTNQPVNVNLPASTSVPPPVTTSASFQSPSTPSSKLEAPQDDISFNTTSQSDNSFDSKLSKEQKHTLVNLKRQLQDLLKLLDDDSQ